MTPPEIYAIRDEGSFADEPGWKTRVVPNLYKAVQIEAPHRHHFGLFEYWDGFGAHEVIVDTPRHRTSMTQWTETEAVYWLKTLRARVADLRRDTRIAYISLFKNEGARAGSTQPHSHTQLIGLPVVPEAERARYERSFAHYREHGDSLVATLLGHEKEVGERLVASRGGFTAFCPYASAYPFEVMVVAEADVGQVDTLDDAAVEALAPLLLSVMRRLQRQLGCFDFNLVVSTPPLQEEQFPLQALHAVGEACRFHLRILPRIYAYGGFEQGTGMYINPVSPELAAKLLREGEDG
jgi:UDPglucose--hexose-1-phosphate uridylyltransferase